MSLDDPRQRICEIGRRIYAKGYAAANDGNLSVRLSANEILCTPTLICKGFMQPDDLCTCNLEGQLLSGNRKLTSELGMHLTIYGARADVQAVVHCHPPHVTAFAITHRAIPSRVLPEIELFLGEVPIAPYATPGTPALGESILPYVSSSRVIVLANHGVVSFAETLERAYWWAEVLDHYCRILLLAAPLGPLVQFNDEQQRELIALRAKWIPRVS